MSFMTTLQFFNKNVINMQRKFAFFDVENKGTLPKEKIQMIMESELTFKEQADLAAALDKLANKKSRKIAYH